MDTQKVIYWPSRDDEVCVPYSKILLRVGVPKVMSHSGRHYTIPKCDIQKTTVEAFNFFFVYCKYFHQSNDLLLYVHCKF